MEKHVRLYKKIERLFGSLTLSLYGLLSYSLQDKFHFLKLFWSFFDPDWSQKE